MISLSNHQNFNETESNITTNNIINIHTRQYPTQMKYKYSTIFFRNMIVDFLVIPYDDLVRTQFYYYYSALSSCIAFLVVMLCFFLLSSWK